MWFNLYAIIFRYENYDFFTDASNVVFNKLEKNAHIQYYESDILNLLIS